LVQRCSSHLYQVLFFVAFLSLNPSAYTVMYPLSFHICLQNAHNMKNIVVHFIFKARRAKSYEIIAALYPMSRHYFPVQGFKRLFNCFPFSPSSCPYMFVVLRVYWPISCLLYSDWLLEYLLLYLLSILPSARPLYSQA
jgi:hypothetical protein